MPRSRGLAWGTGAPDRQGHQRRECRDLGAWVPVPSPSRERKESAPLAESEDDPAPTVRCTGCHRSTRSHGSLSTNQYSLDSTNRCGLEGVSPWWGAGPSMTAQRRGLGQCHHPSPSSSRRNSVSIPGSMTRSTSRRFDLGQRTLGHRRASSDGEATTSSRFDQAARPCPSRDGDGLSRSATCREVFVDPRLHAADSQRPLRTLAATRSVDR
jgi:hypothetical protein